MPRIEREALNRGWGKRDCRSLMALQPESGVSIEVDRVRIARELQDDPPF